jgi:hypothetical protein
MKKPVKYGATPTLLGQAQGNLEAAAKELRSAQSAFEKAASRMVLAEELHQKATTDMANAFHTVKTSNKVVPLSAR